MSIERKRWLLLTIWLAEILTTIPAGVKRDSFKIVFDKMVEIEKNNPII